MATYMLLLYAEDGDEQTRAARWAELPEWDALTRELRERAVWIANAALHPVESATTVRVRDGETTVTDGPFAVTKEILGGYFILDLEDLDAATAVAERLPVARFGSVEVRPLMSDEEMMRYRDAEATAEA
jgi:hypothetical protein